MKSLLNKILHSEFLGKIKNIANRFTMTEKVYFLILLAILLASSFILINNFNKKLSVNEPANGGYIVEGIVGSPRFINPVLAVSDLDHDLGSLIYSGLMKVTADGSLLPDLAQSYEISEDQLSYTFKLRDNDYFSDSRKVTTDDIIFTINKIQDANIKSPKRPSFYDVIAQKISDSEVKFILKKPYAPFLENLTVGILPKYYWNNLSNDEFALSDLNLDPIGSGPYKIQKINSVQKNQVTTKTSYELAPSSKYALGKPYIDRFIVNFYKDENTMLEAYNRGEIESMASVSPDKITDYLKQKSEIQTSPLPRVFGTFFNQNQSEVLAQKEVRLALDLAANKKEIIDTVLNGFGNILNGPIPSGLISDNQDENNYDFDKAQQILAKAGWIKATSTGLLQKKISKSKTIQLKFTISTLNSQDLMKTAELLKADWEKLGAEVTITSYEFGDLQQNIIRPRKYDALLYGMVIGRDMDFFAFWHSSQRNDPGLNIAMYANSKADKFLEDARKTSDQIVREKKYTDFEKEIKNDIPAVFLYSPDFIYILPTKIKGMELGPITLPYERFANVNRWYIETNNIWKIFAK